jgi:hypothetical protein
MSLRRRTAARLNGARIPRDRQPQPSHHPTIARSHQLAPIARFYWRPPQAPNYVPSEGLGLDHIAAPASRNNVTTRPMLLRMYTDRIIGPDTRKEAAAGTFIGWSPSDTGVYEGSDRATRFWRALSAEGAGRGLRLRRRDEQVRARFRGGLGRGHEPGPVRRFGEDPPRTKAGRRVGGPWGSPCGRDSILAIHRWNLALDRIALSRASA